MFKVVQFLESLSLTPRAMTADEYVEAIAQAGLDADAQRVLKTRDAEALSALLGGRTNVMALVFPAENEPGSDEPATDEPDSEPKEGDHDSHADALAA